MGKQRLVGTVVLLALAIIFIPMILDFSRDEETVVLDIEIPPAPDANTMRVLPLNAWSKKIDPEVKAEPLFVEPTVAAAKEEAPELKPEPKEARVEDKAVLVPKKTPQPPPDVVAPAALVTEKGEKKWAVQIGSFAVADKAQVLRDQLRQKGYSSYIVAGDGPEKKYYRVRVGPIGQKSEALAIQKTLKTETGLDGFVMRY